MRFERIWALPVVAIVAACAELPPFTPELVATVSVAADSTTVGQSKSFTPVTASGGEPPYVFVVSPALPSGMQFSEAGGVSGTPTTAASGTYTVTVSDKSTQTDSATFFLKVNARPVASPTPGVPVTFPAGRAVTPFRPITVANGTAPFTYSISPSLPAGLVLEADGRVSGTPTGNVGSTEYTVTVTDAAGSTATAKFTLAVSPALQTRVVVAAASCTVGAACPPFAPVAVDGGTGPLVWSILPTLPTGLTLNPSTGEIRGTPTAVSATAPYTVTVTDALNVTSSQTFQLTVNLALSATVAVPTKGCTVGQPCAYTPVSGVGGTAPLTYSVAPALPSGLSFSGTTGAISGSPTGASAQASYTVTVRDAAGGTATASFSLAVNARPTATVAVPTKACTAGATCAYTPVTVSGGAGPLSYAVTPQVSNGLSFSATTGAVSGTPAAAAAQASYTVTATDQNGATATGSFQLTVNAALVAMVAVPTTACTVNALCPTFTPVTVVGGTAPLVFSVAPPGLPAGLTIAAGTGAISGTATASANGSFTMTVTDAVGATASAAFQLTVSGPLTTTVVTVTKACTVGRPCAYTPVSASGGTPPLAFAVSPQLPTGLSYSLTTGAITGTPSVASPQTNYAATVTDASTATSTRAFQLTVNAAPTATVLVPAKQCTVGVACAFTPVAYAGGTAPITSSATPSLPSGMSFNPVTGAISGTPSAALPQTTYTVTGTDLNGATASGTFQLTINIAPTATTNPLYTQIDCDVSNDDCLDTANASITFPVKPVDGLGGTGPLTYSITSGTLPAGWAFTSAGNLTRPATLAQQSSITLTVTVTDANGATATATFQLRVQP